MVLENIINTYATNWTVWQ